MTWRLVSGAPTSSVGKSVVSLCSCLGLHSAGNPAPGFGLHSVLLTRSSSCRRGLCWVRRTPCVPRKAATPAALPQDSPQKKDLSFVDVPPLGEDVSVVSRRSTSYALVGNASGPAFTSENVGAAVNLAAQKLTNFYDNAMGNPFQAQGMAASSTAANTYMKTTEPISSSGLAASSSGAASDSYADSQTKVRRMLNSNHALINDLKDGQLKWFPYLDQFQVKDRVLTSTQIMNMLGPFMLEERKNRIKRVVANRTYTICPVVEGLLDLGNIAAVFRTADAFGFQSVHVISNDSDKRYKKNRRISMGSEKWLDAELYEATEDCFEELRSRGYRIAVASITEKSVPLYDIDWTVPTAVVFGNEYKGVSMEALQLADFTFHIPMEGMVDSFNVSVAAGIVMHHAVNDRKTRLGKHGDLTEMEQSILSADFYLRHSSRSLSMIDQLLKMKQEERKCDLRSVLRGDLELDIELPEHLKLDLEKICAEFNPS